MAFAAGHNLLADELNPPVFAGLQTVTQNVANTTWTLLTFDVEVTDTHGGHSTSSNTGQYVIPLTGTYDLAAGAAWANNATGMRGVKIFKNGVIIYRALCYIQAAATVGTTPFVLVKEPLLAGDVITVLGWQSSGGVLATLANGEGASHLEISMIRRG